MTSAEITAYFIGNYYEATGGSCLDMNDIVGERQLCTSTSGSWQFLSGTWSSGSNTSLTLRLITDGSPSGDIWFDDISLQGPGGPTATPANTNTPIPPSSTGTPTPTFTATPYTPGPTPRFVRASFVYDGDGKRVKSVMQTNYGTTTTYFVGNGYEVTGSSVTKYYYAGAQRIAMSKDGTLSFLLGDHLGSTSLMTDATGNLISEMKYKAWGEARYTWGETATDYTYTGQYSYTGDFGLMYYNARWYDLSLGRFAQADTIVPGAANSQAYDRYAYVSNNPLRYVDPSGHDWKCIGANEDHCYDDGEGTVSGMALPTPAPAPASTPAPTLGLIPGIYQDIDAPGPTWDQQMAGWPGLGDPNPLGLVTYSNQYPGTGDSANYGKAGQANGLANNNPNPSAPTALICMSAGSESCLLYLLARLDQGYKTTHIVLIGATWNGAGRSGFGAWTDILNSALLDGTKILVVNDASVANLDVPSTYTVSDQTGTYEKVGVPYSYSNGGTVLCHHSTNCGGMNLGADNSADLVSSVYQWISTGQWSWP